ncbi:MAG: type pantothenate kinase [Akkermansiaceae bacterium]|nr:type pantothenate kinase [Akkermansiaceae bacterium]
MSWLLIDNSNTRTKFALGDATRLSTWRAWLPTAEISDASLNTLLAEIKIDGVLLCSVVPEKARIIREHFEPRLPFHAMSARSRLNIGIDYPQPEQIGADRLANAVGVGAAGAPAIVIDFGTAVTFDVVEEGPTYCGGVIAPGLGAMQDYLGKKTALLPRIDLEEPAAAIGKSTIAAMQSGAVYGYRGLVKEIIARLRAEMTGSPWIVATGGDAALIARGVPEIDAVDPDLTLEGIRLTAMLNMP